MDWLLLEFLLAPFLACVVLVLIHSYLGIHVLARGVIFVDIALAQIAALGTTVAFLTGHDADIHGPTAYAYSLGFTFVGATIFALSRNLRERVPQEAFIGIAYAVASAAAILLVGKSAHGAEHIKHILVGNLLTVTPAHIGVTAGIYAAVGAFHYAFRKRFLSLSFEPDAPEQRSRTATLWDLAFYMTFGLVITSSVQIAGVLLVFTFLIVPAVFAALFASRLLARLLLSWAFGIAVAGFGVAGSLFLDLPTGAAIVVTFGIALVLAAIARWALTRFGARERGPASAPAETTGSGIGIGIGRGDG